MERGAGRFRCNLIPRHGCWKYQSAPAHVCRPWSSHSHLTHAECVDFPVRAKFPSSSCPPLCVCVFCSFIGAEIFSSALECAYGMWYDRGAGEGGRDPVSRFPMAINETLKGWDRVKRACRRAECKGIKEATQHYWRSSGTGRENGRDRSTRDDYHELLLLLGQSLLEGTSFAGEGLWRFFTVILLKD